MSQFHFLILELGMLAIIIIIIIIIINGVNIL